MDYNNLIKNMQFIKKQHSISLLNKKNYSIKKSHSIIFALSLKRYDSNTIIYHS
jgi:hypothetical protein